MKKLLQTHLFCFITFVLSVSVIKAQEIDRKLWTPNGTVTAIVRDSSNIYIAGMFDYIFPNTGGGAMIDSQTGALKDYSSFPHINGSVYTSVPDGNGGWYIGGDFTMVGGFQRIGLAHILSNNRLDLKWSFDLENLTFELDSAHQVFSLLIDNDILYIGGRFSKIGQHNRNLIASINLSTNTLTDWNPLLGYNWKGYGYFPMVRGMTIYNNLIYLAGAFDSVNGIERKNLAAVDIKTGQLASWNPFPDDVAFTLLSYKDRIYVGGVFTQMNNVNRQSLAALNPLTGELITEWNPWTTFTPHISQRNGRPSVAAMAVKNDVLYASGKLSLEDTYSNRFFNKIIAVNTTYGGTLWEKKVNGGVSTIVVKNDLIYVGGDFSSIDHTISSLGDLENDGFKRQNLASIDIKTNTVTSWQLKPQSEVYSINIMANSMYIGGGPT